MGLTSWRVTRVRKSDVGIAKNYLSKKEIEGLNDLVEQPENQHFKTLPNSFFF